MPWPPMVLEQFQKTADPVADRVVERFIASSGAEVSHKLFELLIRNLQLPVGELPEFVKDYHSEASRLPDWADLDQLRRAENLFKDKGLGFAVVLYFRSLPECYIIPSIADVLYATGRLSGRDWPQTYARRVGETTQFLLDVCAPGGMEPNGIGIETLLRVRLVHASIRHFLQASPEWAPGKVAINQLDLSYTLVTFGYSMVDGLRRMGIEVSDKDAEAFFHLWRVAGHILGIQEDILPANMQEGKNLLEFIQAKFAQKTEAGIACTTALTAFSKDILTGQTLDVLPEAMVRYMMGDVHAVMLGVPFRQGCMARLVPKALTKLLAWTERLEDRIPVTSKVTDPMGAAILTGMRKYFHSYKGNGLRLPKDLERAWGLG